MRFKDYSIVLQEVPNEVTLCLTITGCKLACDGCHSPYLWKEGSGIELTENIFIGLLERYKNLITCVLFMGGEWEKDTLINFLIISKQNKLKTCLYTGLYEIDSGIKSELTFLKTGPWEKTLGGLENINTNQKFIDIDKNEILNHLFMRNNSF